MSKFPVPQRPDTSSEEAIEALERIVLEMVKQVAILKGGDREHGHAVVQGWRSGLLSALDQLPSSDQRARVLDHMDWMFSLAELGLRPPEQ